MLVMLVFLIVSSLAAQPQDPAEDPTAAGETQDQEEAQPFQDPGGMYGEYVSSQESSGTSWQPASKLETSRFPKTGGMGFHAPGFCQRGLQR